MSTVRTRFAPSPTGYMHIGGMRTALFNWLWARHCGGKFILRIDDTDQARNQEAALAPILRAFRWLGLDWDEGAEVGGPFAPYYQSQRGELYRAGAARLERAGLAYRDFSTKAELDADRKQAEREKRPYINIRRSLDLSDSDKAQFAAEGRPWVLRFLIPRDEKVTLDDHIRGRVEWDAGLLPDPVILRPDGSALYNFATVVDDAQMQITHVIRAEEHLSNTPIQIFLHRALGNALPEFAHVPYVAAPGSKEKLSKRKIEQYRKNPQFQKLFERGDEVFGQLGLAESSALDPVMVEYYERIGYLPEAVLNALGRIGWSLDDTTEIMSLATMKEHFTLDRVVKAPAGFDPDKLFSFQSHWMKELPPEQKLAGCLPYLTSAELIGQPVSDRTTEFVREVIAAMGDRLKLFSDILSVDFLFRDQFTYDEKNFDKRVRKEGVPGHLAAFRDILAGLEPFTVPAIEAALSAYCQETGEPTGTLIHALRLSTTGQPVGPGVYDCVALLGREKTIARIDASLEKARS
ncbi:MAG TPA: glutamate--tRNA ligase [Planctomycetaceae bacterium]|nr:glutamate--tRNA ligase [Planctomycetaceae bacterium]